MAPDKAQLHAQLAQYKQQHAQLLANANACSGAIQALEAVLVLYDQNGSDGPPVVPDK